MLVRIDDNVKEPPLGRGDAEDVAWVPPIHRSWNKAEHTRYFVKVLEFPLSATRNHWDVLYSELCHILCFKITL